MKPDEYSFSSHTFTNGGKTGTYGPSLSELKSSYGAIRFCKIQITLDATNGDPGGYTVVESPSATDLYDIDVYGAQGGGNYSYPNNGGKGARIKARFADNKRRIFVDCRGSTRSIINAQQRCGWWRGGSFVIKPPKNSRTGMSAVISRVDIY